MGALGWRAEAPQRWRAVQRGTRRQDFGRRRAYPLLPRYVLIELPLPAPWWQLRDFPLVQGVVCLAGEPAEMEKTMIDNFLTRMTAEAAEVVASALAVGTVVEITDGPLAGSRAAIAAINGKRLELKVGANARVSVPRQNVRAA